jgi:sodium/potassium-transporting ATPase subunit alpha
VMGHIANMAGEKNKEKKPLRKDMDFFVLVIAIWSIIIGIVFFLLAYLALGYDVLTSIFFGIGIIVANAPEGLVGTIGVALTLTAKRLSSKFVLVKNLESVETLGSTSCICSDKTGTLTQNKMSVS